MTDYSTLVKGDNAVIFYGMGGPSMRGTIAAVKTNADKSVRLVGITPEGTNHVAWFAPSPEMYGLLSVGGSTVAYA